jgi:hypothetical protein
MTRIQAQDICSKFTLSKDIASDQISGDDLSFLNFLVKKSYYVDAINFVSHALDPFILIEWGFTCVSATDLNSENNMIRQMILEWLKTPDDTKRRAIQKQGKDLDTINPYYWLSWGVFWSGGSIVEPDMSSVFPQEGLLAHAISGAVMLAAVQDNGKNMKKNYENFLKQGLTLLEGKH